MTLDKLRALDKAASPGDWHFGQCDLPHTHDDRNAKCVLTKPVPPGPDYEVWTDDELVADYYTSPADAQLAALSKLLLPAMEALEKTASLLDGIHEGDEELHAVRHARAVLAQLEEALDDAR